MSIENFIENLTHLLCEQANVKLLYQYWSDITIRYTDNGFIKDVSANKLLYDNSVANICKPILHCDNIIIANGNELLSINVYSADVIILYKHTNDIIQTYLNINKIFFTDFTYAVFSFNIYSKKCTNQTKKSYLNSKQTRMVIHNGMINSYHNYANILESPRN